jgi:predicted glycoside hydrolase/deacetylase ChbG (UPF0249 family)
MPPRLILNADDFGLTRGINRAVIELHRAGVLTSTTLMATGPAFDDAAALALANPGLGVGCHLVFTDGMPISHPDSIPTLLGADGKTFRPSLIDFAVAVLRGIVRVSDIARETQAQIQKLQRAGLDVTHVDTHKHTHLLPRIAATVVHIAARCGIGSIRNPIEPRWSVALSHASWKRHLGMRLMDRFGPSFNRLTADARSRGLIPDGTLGIAVTGLLNPPRLRAMLDCLVRQRANATFELLCHPGYNDADLDAQATRLRASRELEYRTLLEVIPEYSRNPAALELIHYGNLGVPGLQRASGQYIRSTGFEKVL